jgi:hypothetical protein
MEMHQLIVTQQNCCVTMEMPSRCIGHATKETQHVTIYICGCVYVVNSSIILPCAPSLPKRSLPCRFSGCILYAFLISPVKSNYPAHLLLDLGNSKEIWRSLQISFLIRECKSCGSSASIVSDYRLPGFHPWQKQRIFSLASVSRPALRPTQPPVQWIPVDLCQEVKRGRSVTLTAHPIYCRGQEWFRAKTPLPLRASMAEAGELYFTFMLQNVLHPAVTFSKGVLCSKTSSIHDLMLCINVYRLYSMATFSPWYGFFVAGKGTDQCRGHDLPNKPHTVKWKRSVQITNECLNMSQ